MGVYIVLKSVDLYLLHNADEKCFNYYVTQLNCEKNITILYVSECKIRITIFLQKYFDIILCNMFTKKISGIRLSKADLIDAFVKSIN